MQQTIQVTRSTVSAFVSSRPSDPAFEVLLQALKVSLEAVETLVSQWLKCEVQSVRTDVLLDIGRADILIRQKSDQIHFLFVEQPTQPAVNKLTNNKARTLWSEAFGEEVRLVPWTEFFPVFLHRSGEFESVANDPDDLEVLRNYLDFTLDGWVSVYELEIFLRSFSPLKGSAQRLLEPYKAGILAGYVPSIEATALLQGREAGSYLVRFSKSQAGHFAVTFVDSKRRVKHCLLYYANPGVTLREPPDVFPTLEQFVRAHSQRLRIGLGAQAQRMRPAGHSITMTLDNAYTRSLSSKDGDAYSLDMVGDDDDEDDEAASRPTAQCVVCMAAAVATCFIPCGHVCCCKACGDKLARDVCPICRNTISSVQKIFMA